MAMSEALLSIAGAATGYGITQVLFGLDLTVGRGEIVSLNGRNGMGRTTTIRMLVGLLPVWSGGVTFAGQSLGGLPAHRIARLGVGLVPEGRHIFPSLSVRENLLATAKTGAEGGRSWTIERVLEIFPRLADRLDRGGAMLSGGEQQMLAIGRALMTNPSLLVLDEATEGLAPLIRSEIWAVLGHLKAAKQAVLVVDKNLDALMKLADRHYVVERGRIVWSGTGSDLNRDRRTVEQFLTV
jgi:branched-chain amino acid transport system ATP-binding protein